jgi:superfamily II DNA/RNA helicase
MMQRVMQRVQLDDDSTKLSNRKEKRLQRTTQVSTVAKDSAPNIQHRAIRLNQGDRTQALRYLIEQNSKEWDRVLVFVGTRYASEHVTRKLRRYGIKAAELHGKLDQEARERRLKSFRSGNTQVLISTDVSARGIDVEGLPVVVNYDLPRGAADFTHRTGRTGRAGKDGLAVSFITASKASHFDFIEKKELGGKVIEREVLPDFMPDEDAWLIESAAGETSIPGVTHSQQGLAHDRMFGGVKGRRKSKKDKLREAAATLHRNVI